MATECEWTIPSEEPCCCPQECCLYPWPDPNNQTGDGPFYPDDDLPDTILVYMDGSYAPFPLTAVRQPGEYYYLGDYTYGGEPGTVIIYPDGTGTYGEVWVMRDWDGAAPIGFYGSYPCLIGDYGAGVGAFDVEDEFLDTYSITFPNASPDGDIVGSVTRETPCRWEGAGSDGINSWVIVMEFIVDPDGVEPGGYIVWKARATSGTSSEQPTGYKLTPENQSSPEGEYSTESPITTVAIVTP